VGQIFLQTKHRFLWREKKKTKKQKQKKKKERQIKSTFGNQSEEVRAVNRQLL
jgi:hypothetical protein